MADKVEAKLEGSKRTLLLRPETENRERKASAVIISHKGGSLETVKVDDPNTCFAVNMDAVAYVRWNGVDYYGNVD